MRSALFLAVLGLALAATPARAQFHFSPLVGYDIDYEAFTAGLAFELGVTPSILPVKAAIRPSVEYVFADGVDLFRVNGDLIGRFGAVGVPLSPYAKAGVAVEFISDDEDTPNIDEGDTDVGLNLGLGVIFNNFFVEGTFRPAGSVSDGGVTVGYRF